MDLETFRTGSILHLACLLVCGLTVFALVRFAKSRDSPEFRRRMRWFVAGGCLVSWLVNAVFMLAWGWPDLSWTLPLHFCNLANLIGAVAVLSRARWPKTVIYLWACALCIWAFLTPTLNHGPAHGAFWIFWIYHLFIPIALVEILVVQRYRPNWIDFRNAWLFTFAFSGILVVVNVAFGWDYGFVGPSTPENPTLLDVLGPWPLRLLWMTLIGTALFALLIGPWQRRIRRT